MPAISVIVPVYRAENLLAKCVESILGQSFGDFELILIDDGSPDQSGALCDQFARQDERVRVIHQANGGVSAARNAGMAAAQGDFLAFCDADDYLALNALERLYTAAAENGADTAGCGHYYIWPDGRTQEERGALPAGTYGPEQLRAGIVEPLLGRRLDFGSGVFNGFVVRFLYSRTVIQSNDISFEGAYLEDELFLMEYFLHAEKLAMVDDPLYYYLQNPASVTRSYLPGYMDVFSRCMERKRALAEKYGLDRNMPDWEDNAVWAGLLIAVGNEYAPGSPKTLREKTAEVRALCRRPETARAMERLKPKGLAGNKQLVADLVMGGHFRLLSLLYYVKNRRR